MSAPEIRFDLSERVDPYPVGRWGLWDMVANCSFPSLNHLMSEVALTITVARRNSEAQALIDRGVMADDPDKDAKARKQSKESVDFIAASSDNLMGWLRCSHIENAVKRLKYWATQERGDWIDLFHRAVAVREAINTELKEYLYYQYPKEKGERFSKWKEEWKLIILAFPETERDIFSAVDCYALQHNTASVFHSMRVAEHGLRALAKERKLKLPKDKLVEWATWQEIIRALDNEIKAVGLKKAGKAKDRALEFYSGSRADINGFKDEYRNAVMHVREHYDEFQAIRALTKVHAFMDRVAAKIDHTHKRVNWSRS